MKIFALLFLLLGLGNLNKETETTELARITLQELIASADYLATSEKAMIWEINLVRSDPQSYLPFVQEKMAELRADSARISTITSESIRRIVRHEKGKEVVTIDTIYINYYENRMMAISELLIELGKAVPVEGLAPYHPLYTAAVKHGDIQAEKQYIDHRGLDGSWPLDRQLRESEILSNGNENIVRAKGTPREIIIQLLIDSGVPHRGHRQNILNPEWKYVTCHHVRQLDENDVEWWIQEFAY